MKSPSSPWNHTPALPLPGSPYLNIPVQPRACLRWLFRSWLPITERLVIFAITLLAWWFFLPPLSVATEFKAGWILQLYLLNLTLVTITAGGLHLYLYRFKAQANTLKFDRSMANKDATRFTFGNQLWDNVFWTLCSGVTVMTAFEVILLWAHANGYGAMLYWSDNPLWFAVLFLLIPMLNSVWFFIIHRALHIPFLYRTAHHIHHRNVSIGPWSGNAMHPLEHLMWLSGVFIHLVIASNPVHILFTHYMQVLSAVTSHSGYEGLSINGKKRFGLGDFFHQLHHRHYNCNYGTVEVPLDRLVGAFHDGTPDGAKAIKKRTSA